MGWHEGSRPELEGGEPVAVGVLVGVLADVSAVVLEGGPDPLGLVHQPGPVLAVGIGGLGSRGRDPLWRRTFVHLLDEQVPVLVPADHLHPSGHEVAGVVGVLEVGEALPCRAFRLGAGMSVVGVVPSPYLVFVGPGPLLPVHVLLFSPAKCPQVLSSPEQAPLRGSLSGVAPACPLLPLAAVEKGLRALAMRSAIHVLQ